MQSDTASDPPPASAGNRERQARSRMGITHPIAWEDGELESEYSEDRLERGSQVKGGGADKTARRDRLRELHASDDGGSGRS